jgi:outer membrane protein TolC
VALVVGLVLAFSTFPLTAWAQRAPADTVVVGDLGSLLDLVRRANPTLAAARLGASALAQRPEQVGSLPDPTFGFGVQPIPIVTARGSQRTQWQVQQAFPFPGKLGLMEEAAEWEARASVSSADRLEQELLERTKVLYFDLTRVLRQLALIREFQASLANFEAVANSHYVVGTGSQQAILKAQLERNALSNRALELAKSRHTLLESLSQLINRPVALQDSLPSSSTAPDAGLEQAALIETALRNRPETATLDALLNRSTAMIDLAHKEWLPDFGVGLTYFDIADTKMPASADGRNAVAIGVTVRVPLQRGRLRARLKETELMRQQLAARKEALETSYRTDISDLLYQLAREREQIALFADALIPQATTTLAATLSAYTTGRVSFLELLDAERMLFDLRWSYEASRSALLKTGAKLERAVGIGHLDTLTN